MEKPERASIRGWKLALLAGGPLLLLAVGGVVATATSARVSQGAQNRHADMIRFPAAMTQIGDDRAPRDERPQFSMAVGEFSLDRTPVTVAQFRSFVERTKYVTEAEKFGNAGVFVKGPGAWMAVAGATWRKPAGLDGADAVDDHPVTQVSWNDASAFCAAYGARLPTEFEWERAARLGQTPDGTVFAAGTSASLAARARANTWQGVFPVTDTGDDGYLGTSPVGAFGAAPSGLTDMAGNVWEWTSSSYVPYQAAQTDLAPPERVQRGGSFLCSLDVCDGFRATARSHSTPDTSLMHVGFRCAADASPPAKAGRVSDLHIAKPAA